MNIFLKLKHWQIFALLVCTYLAFQIAGKTTVISSQGTIKQITEHNCFSFMTSSFISDSQEEVSTAIPSKTWVKSFKVTKYSPIVILFIFVLFGWFYAMGINLNKKIPDTVKMNLKKFKLFMFLPIVYMFIFYIFVHFVLLRSVSNGIHPNPIIYIIIIPLHLFSMFCLFYCIYFNAKSIKSVELQRPVTFSDYIIDFFLLWFFPIGVWFIQPKINKIFDATLQAEKQI